MLSFENSFLICFKGISLTYDSTTCYSHDDCSSKACDLTANLCKYSFSTHSNLLNP